MTQPNRPQKRIIPLLIQKQLSAVSQSRIHFTILIDIRCDHPRTRGVVQVKDRAFADVDEETDIFLASVIRMLVNNKEGGRGI
jgi:hypothetical protein